MTVNLLPLVALNSKLKGKGLSTKIVDDAGIKVLVVRPAGLGVEVHVKYLHQADWYNSGHLFNLYEVTVYDESGYRLLNIDKDDAGHVVDFITGNDLIQISEVHRYNLQVIEALKMQ